MESWQTHEVSNQTPPLENYNLFDSDRVLQEALQREGASWAAEQLQSAGAELGTAQAFDLGRVANLNTPVLRAFDSRGNRTDFVEFHPAWHEILTGVMRRGLHSAPWADPKPDAHVARAAAYMMQGQTEAGSLCPTTMTYGAIPALQKGEQRIRDWLPTLYSREHDPRDLPFAQKKGGMIGMGMTEKQGGSDVRANTTQAQAIGNNEYLVTGHKWFFSAPMCDAHLVLAQTPKGPSCIFMPRWRPDGSKNPIQVQRLKEKVGNRSNSSSEVEFRDAWGLLLGEEGRGVPTIIEMATYTRLDCCLGTSAGMRQALSQAMHHASHRSAFGARLIDQPLMRNVLADLALETEAAATLSLRMARAFDSLDNESENAFRRLVTPAAKYWICKRGPELAAEAMEVLGGNGYVDDGMLARIYREMPVNSIWEGSGNIMCLDLLRAFSKTPNVLHVLMAELTPALGRHAAYDTFLGQLQRDFADSSNIETRARRLTQNLTLALQASLLLQHAPDYVSDAFCRSRLAHDWGYNFGTLPANVDFASLLNRAWPNQ